MNTDHRCSGICKKILEGSRAHWNSLTHLEQKAWAEAKHSWWARIVGWIKRLFR